MLAEARSPVLSAQPRSQLSLPACTGADGLKQREFLPGFSINLYGIRHSPTSWRHPKLGGK